LKAAHLDFLLFVTGWQMCLFKPLMEPIRRLQIPQKEVLSSSFASIVFGLLMISFESLQRYKTKN
jgi:hypothetical protein